MLPGAHTLLINMVPRTIHILPPPEASFPGTLSKSSTPPAPAKKIHIGAFRVPNATRPLDTAALDTVADDTSEPHTSTLKKPRRPHYYFSSPSADIAVTRAVPLGAWVYGLPGSYEASLHSSIKRINLIPGERMNLAIGYLKLKAPLQLPTQNTLAVKRRPYTASLDTPSEDTERYNLELSDVYPLFPGPYRLWLDYSPQPIKIEVAENEVTEVPLQALTVRGDCSDQDWGCHGAVDTILYQTPHPAPMVLGSSDIPLLFPQGDVQVLLSTSLGLRKTLSFSEDYQTFSLGKVIIQPLKHTTGGRKTEMIRIETSDTSPLGASLDLSDEQSTTLELLPGAYRLTSYLSQWGGEERGWEKITERHRFSVKPGKTVTLKAHFYTPQSPAEL